jgi:CRISPR/Cas system Type II protein with McrA/HNH and RuvC-like nuclease domain
MAGSKEHFERVKETHALQFRRIKVDEATAELGKRQSQIAAFEQKVAYLNKKVEVHVAMTGHGMALADKGKIYSDVVGLLVFAKCLLTQR